MNFKAAYLRNFKLKKSLVFILLMACVSFFLFFVLDGLPFSTQGIDDVMWIEMAKPWSFGDLIEQSFSRTELTQPGSVETRPVHVLLVKLFFSIFGTTPVPSLILNGLSLALVCFFVYFFVFKITQNSFISTFAALFYLTIPTVVYATMWISEIGIVAQALLIGGFYFFLLAYSKSSNLSITKFVFYSIPIIFIFIIAMHTKETTKIAPFVLISYILITNWKKLIKFSFFLIPLFYMIIPLGFKFKSVSTINLDFFNSLFYHNTQTGFGAESASSLFSPISQILNVPGSVVGSFGFFISWLFVISIIYLIFKIGKKFIINLFKIEKGFSESWCWLFFVFIWSLAALAILVKVPGPWSRYIVAVLLPFVILVFSAIWIFAKQINFKRYRNLFKIVIFIFILITILPNTYHSLVEVRGGLGGMWIQFYQALGEIYYSEKGTELEDSKLYDMMMDEKFEGIPFSRIIFSQRPFHFFHSPNAEEIVKSLDSFPRVYVISLNPNFSLNNGNIAETRISELYPCNEAFYCKVKRLIYKALGKEERLQAGVSYLYKISSKS